MAGLCWRERLIKCLHCRQLCHRAPNVGLGEKGFPARIGIPYCFIRLIDMSTAACSQVVVHEGKVLEKPESIEEARSHISGYGHSPAATVGSVLCTNLRCALGSAVIRDLRPCL